VSLSLYVRTDVLIYSATQLQECLINSLTYLLTVCGIFGHLALSTGSTLHGTVTDFTIMITAILGLLCEEQETYRTSWAKIGRQLVGWLATWMSCGHMARWIEMPLGMG